LEKVASEQNVIQILLVADSYSEATLKLLCTKYILDHYITIVKSDEFKTLITAENSDLILGIMNELSAPSKKRKLTKETVQDSK